MKNAISKSFHKSKSAGYKRLHVRAADSYAGLSKRQVRTCSTTNNKIKKIKSFHIKFTKKAKPRTAKVRRVYEQHQDLVDMKSMQIEYHGKKYRYILSLMDVFSRFHWLAPLETKKSMIV